MRWTTTKSPEHGDERIIKRFLWLPLRLKDGRRFWLETVEVRQVYDQQAWLFGSAVWNPGWTDMDFLV